MPGVGRAVLVGGSLIGAAAILRSVLGGQRRDSAVAFQNPSFTGMGGAGMMPGGVGMMPGGMGMPGFGGMGMIPGAGFPTANVNYDGYMASTLIQPRSGSQYSTQAWASNWCTST